MVNINKPFIVRHKQEKPIHVSVITCLVSHVINEYKIKVQVTILITYV